MPAQRCRSCIVAQGRLTCTVHTPIVLSMDTAQQLTQKEAQLLHRAGIGMFRPMGEVIFDICDGLVDRGLMQRGERGIYGLTETGAMVLSESGL
jgi:hypothetical protein